MEEFTCKVCGSHRQGSGGRCLDCRRQRERGKYKGSKKGEPCARCGVNIRMDKISWCSPCNSDARRESTSRNANKPCATCGKNPRASGATSCRPCLNERNRPKTPEQKKKVYLRSKFGMTPEQYDAMMNAQQGLCAICKRPPDWDGRDACVDHCHVTGIVRGILCNPCNLGIGNFKDDIIVMERAISYLRLYMDEGGRPNAGGEPTAESQGQRASRPSRPT